MLFTGDKNFQFGIYQASCCGYEIVLVDGGVFPKCPEHKRPTEWKLIAEIESGTTRDSDSESAA